MGDLNCNHNSLIWQLKDDSCILMARLYNVFFLPNVVVKDIKLSAGTQGPLHFVHCPVSPEGPRWPLICLFDASGGGGLSNRFTDTEQGGGGWRIEIIKPWID